MRKAPPDKLERGRIRGGRMGSTADEGMAGAFFVQGPRGAQLVIISSGGDTEFGWEHVSVSLEHRTPNWAEMCFVKELFWDDDEAVMQLHPAKANYVNYHPFCLHLWRPLKATIPLPPPILVGPSGPTQPQGRP